MPPAAPHSSPSATRAAAAPQRQRRKEARPQELLAAALALFVEKGFAATRSEEVAARAGVSKGTLYLYYPSKEELFKAVVRENLSSHIADGELMLAQHQGPMAGLLREVMHEWWQRIGLGPAGGISKIMMAEARNFPELAQFYVDEVIAPTHRLLAGLLERGMASGEFRRVKVDDAVHVLIAPMLHLTLHQHSFGACMLHDPDMDPRRVLDLQLDLMLEGLLSAEQVPERAPEPQRLSTPPAARRPK
ncbi:TetR/AcrR family transcriptional regulator [Pelomonas sp. V22]|uniref:TetR/AcrR family transcriptional regulator n=1 Tax=Pelomonas sp. V22 TaxID=2822139 RepID=UPI0024A9C03D|nr:TetR/AcrR family transcriptional regulator [Pelomonas sp. V22]MDI4633503.1 TetR/AcrR family transcriptional regulator [Pelomonas sp. V22]